MRIVIKLTNDTERRIKQLAILKGIEESEIIDSLKRRAEQFIINEVERELREVL